MSERQILQRLRGFMLGLAAAMFAGAVVELLLAKHWDSPKQLVAFGLCGLGLIALAAYRLRPSRGTLLALRGVMSVIALGSLVGIAFHFLGNQEFALETRRGTEAWPLFLATITGAAPLLAPGMLAAFALLSVAATYAVDRQPVERSAALTDGPTREPALSAHGSSAGRNP